MAKQKMIKTLEKMVENGGVIGAAMKEAKYKDSYANNPQKLERTKAWPELVKKYFPDTKLAKKHGELLNAESETVQLGAVKLGYELSGKIQNVIPASVSQTININFFSKPEIMQATKNLDDILTKHLIDGDEKPKND